MKMEVKTRRHIAAWLLLAVFLPTLIVSSVHVHPNCADTLQCSACVHHKAHSGHLTNGQAPIHACLLCQVFQLSFVAGTSAALLAPILRATSLSDAQGQDIVLRNIHPDDSRAPPFV